MERRLKFLLFVMLIGCFLRLVNLETLPSWDWDEGVNMNIAGNLAEGRAQWFCLKYAFVPHPPLFFMVLAALLDVFGNDLVVLRGLCSVCGILTMPVVYLLGRDLFDQKTGLLAGLLFAVYPTAIYFNRMGFANNQLMFLSALTVYLMLLYVSRQKSRWLFLAGLTTSLSLVTEIQGLAVFFGMAAFLWLNDRKSLVGYAAASSVAPAAFAATMLFFAPDAFINDITHNSGRTNLPALALFLAVIAFLAYPSRIKSRISDAVEYIYGPVFKEIKNNALVCYLLLSFCVFLPPTDDAIFEGFDFFWVGLLGLYYIKDKMRRDLLLSYVAAFFALLLWLDRADHMVIPVYPFFCLLLAVFILRMFDLARSRLQTRSRGAYATIASAVMVFYPIAVASAYSFVMFSGSGFIAEEDMVPRQQVALYLNGRVSPEDVVLVDSHLTRMVDCKASVLIQSAAYEGYAVEYMRGDYEPGRFVFDCSYKNSTFVVMLDETYEWTENKSGFDSMIAEIDGWPMEYVGGYRVYENPAKAQLG